MLPVPDYKYKIKRQNAFNLGGKIKVKLLITSACLVFMLFTAQLVFANSLATDGEKLSKVQEEIQKLEDDNMGLKVKIAKEASLTSLSRKAPEMGFRKPSEIIPLQ